MNEYKYTGGKPRNLAPLITVGGVQIATGFRRIVHGKRGAYVEFEDRHLLFPGYLHVTDGSEWRLDPKHPAYNQCYFALYNPLGEKTRVYHQRRIVDYADYVVGRWYVSPKAIKEFEVVGKYEV